jgi:hypothetical protein
MRVFSAGWKKLWKMRCHLIHCKDKQLRIDDWKALKTRQSTELALRAEMRRTNRAKVILAKKSLAVRRKLKVQDISSYFIKKEKSRVRLIPVGKPTKKTAKVKRKRMIRNQDHVHIPSQVDTSGICFDMPVNSTVSLVRGAIG